jgi:hypothetical protein
MLSLVLFVIYPELYRWIHRVGAVVWRLIHVRIQSSNIPCAFLNHSSWEVIQSLRIDWRLLMGRRACRWGAFVLYYPPRYLALLHYGCTMSLLFPPPWQPHHVSSVHLMRTKPFLIYS